MKKLTFLALSLIPTFVQAYSLDNLEQAIKESNIDSARPILRSISISQLDKERLLIFAQDVSQQRGSLSALITPSSGDLKMLLITPALFVAAVTLEVANRLKDNDPGPFCTLLHMGASLNILATIFKHFYDVRKLYGNSIEIKQLIYKTTTCD